LCKEARRLPSTDPRHLASQSLSGTALSGKKVRNQAIVGR
jgi:hypothetical protein